MSSDRYGWDNAMIEGRRRLALLEHALDPATFRHLAEIGVGHGWKCLDLGAGGGSVCEWLCDRVGDNGRVTALDLDTRFVAALPHKNLEVREEDIHTADLGVGTFDLVHTRWTLMHIADRDRIIPKLVASLRPGGVLFLEEADALPLRMLDRTGFRAASLKVFPVIAPRGAHVDWAHTLPFAMADLGLHGMHAESIFQYFAGRSPLAEFWKISWQRVVDGTAAAGADVSEWNRELAELEDASRVFVGPMTVSVWARKQ